VVFRPSLHPTPSQRAIGRNLALDLVAAIGVGVTMALISALLPAIARRGGLEPLGLSALAAAPFVANLLGAFAGRLGPRSPGELAVIRGIGATSLVLLFFAPVPAVMVLVAVLFWLSVSLGGPFHLRLWGSIYPSRLRGRMVGVIGMGRAAAGALAAFAGGIVADRLGGPTAVAIAGVIGIACALAYAGLRATSNDRAPGFSARDSLRALRERPVLARMVLAQGFYGGGFIAAAPLYALVYVDRLDLSLADVGLIGILAAGSTTIAFPVWGAVADRRGGLVALRVGGAIGLSSLVAYAIAPNVAFLWFGAIAAGFASASIDVGIAAVVSDQTPLATRSAAMAGWNAFTGARGIVAAFLMSALLEVGLVNVTTGLLLCAVSSAVGVALYARTKPGVPVESRAWELAPARGGAA
jgi:MFS transporter, DHA1 family, staphyloferrin B biosynthesis exporter